MPLDVRVPISGLFGVVGLLLLGYGTLVEGLGTSAGKLNGLLKLAVSDLHLLVSEIVLNDGIAPAPAYLDD